MTVQPLVSVVTLVYHTNYKFVIKAIDSIYSQTHNKIEHIVINDAPSDTTNWPIIKKHIQDKNYPSLIIEHSENKGITNNLNEFLAIANGKYFAGCSDDYWEPEFLSKQIKFLENQNEMTAGVFSKVSYIDEQDLITQVNSTENLCYINEYSYSEQLSKLIEQNFVVAPSVVVKIEILKSLNGYYTNLHAEDFQMWYRMLLNEYTLKYNENNLIQYRVNSSGASNTYESSGKMALDRCRLFNQTKDLTPASIWLTVEPLYYKFVKRVIQHSDLTHQIKREIVSNAIQDLSYFNRYLFWFIVTLKLYKFKLIRTKIG
jgi:glycosyltransferase involved in cell wall biosynthesis